MPTEAIHTLNARDNFFLKIVKDLFKREDGQMHIEINKMFGDCQSILKKKTINYKVLKSALVPNIDRKEIGLVFDSKKIESGWYGLDIFSLILPLFDKKSCNSILCGDFIGNDKIKEELFVEFFREILSDKKIEYNHHSDFFIVYINNLSDKMIATFREGLKVFDPYMGYFDLTYSSFIKTHLSTTLANRFIKSKTIIIQGHEDDRGNNEDVNVAGYPFEENGYKYVSIQSRYYNLFLSYKIERKVFDGFESDVSFSINAISKNVLDLSNFNLLIEEAKLQYLLNNKEANLKRAGLSRLTVAELEEFIKNKITSNYIYNLAFLQEYGTVKFNIVIETTAVNAGEKVKLMVALEYMSNETLRLITMF